MIMNYVTNDDYSLFKQRSDYYPYVGSFSQRSFVREQIYANTGYLRERMLDGFITNTVKRLNERG